jgi:hypothetical protein
LASLLSQQAAQERKSPLADAPAIRKRFELRDKRFELGVGLAATIGQDFYNALLLNVRLGFHITDWLGVSVSAGVVNMTPNWRSAFNDKLNSALGGSCRLPPTPPTDPPTDALAQGGNAYGRKRKDSHASQRGRPRTASAW